MKLLVTIEVPDDTAEVLQATCTALANAATMLRRDVGMIEGPFGFANGTVKPSQGPMVNILWMGLRDHRLARQEGLYTA